MVNDLVSFNVYLQSQIGCFKAFFIKGFCLKYICPPYLPSKLGFIFWFTDFQRYFLNWRMEKQLKLIVEIHIFLLEKVKEPIHHEKTYIHTRSRSILLSFQRDQKILGKKTPPQAGVFPSTKQCLRLSGFPQVFKSQI